MPSSRRCRARRGLAASAPLVLSIAVGPCPSGAQTLQDKLAACTACHGETGQSQDPNVPSIGGQPKLFVMYQLFFYREGRRANPEMNTIAKDMSDADLTAISEYVAGLPAPPLPSSGAIDEARYRRGAELADKRTAAVASLVDGSAGRQRSHRRGSLPP